jgi:hypothetical protein
VARSNGRAAPRTDSARAAALSGLGVVVKRECACGCGLPVTGRADKKYAAEACSKRARRRAASEPAVPVVPPSTTIADALREELVELGVIRKAEAAIALQLARQLDAGSIVGSQYVSLSKELDRRVDALRLMGERPDDPVSAIRRRFEAHQLKLVRESS